MLAQTNSVFETFTDKKPPLGTWDKKAGTFKDV